MVVSVFGNRSREKFDPAQIRELRVLGRKVTGDKRRVFGSRVQGTKKKMHLREQNFEKKAFKKKKKFPGAILASWKFGIFLV